MKQYHKGMSLAKIAIYEKGEDLMNADFYLVRVQDAGEVYDYLFSTLLAAQKLFEDEMLPCSLIALDFTNCKKVFTR